MQLGGGNSSFIYIVFQSRATNLESADRFGFFNNAGADRIYLAAATTPASPGRKGTATKGDKTLDYHFSGN